MGSKETREKAKASFQMSDDHSTDQGDVSRDGERRQDLKYILMTEQSGLNDRLDDTPHMLRHGGHREQRAHSNMSLKGHERGDQNCRCYSPAELLPKWAASGCLLQSKD